MLASSVGQVERAHLEFFADHRQELRGGTCRFGETPGLCVDLDRTIGVEYQRVRMAPDASEDPDPAEPPVQDAIDRALRSVADSSVRPVRLADVLNQLAASPVGAGLVVTDFVELFQQAIDAKAGGFPKYLDRCDECWLLLVGDPRRSSGGMLPTQGTLSHVYRSPFARIYFFDWAAGSLHPLRTSTTGDDPKKRK